MSRGGIRVPEVVLLRNQVLLMSFIGRDGRPAPKLKEAAERMSAEELGTAYNQVNENKHSLQETRIQEVSFRFYSMMTDVVQSVAPRGSSATEDII